MTSVHGKVVFSTGGARGTGAEVAHRLRNKGAKLVLTDLDQAWTRRRLPSSSPRCLGR
jgi:NAD(P)-dependent dehydrogenase (short-subunit alcohol dehydrogenase family)